ncbi:putative RNA polymerase II subunit A C-terminal domain phosphatase SSU72 [Apostichopus japonicus]|uniref:RNA polymerase II subunit A C-terminal domain phosphatase SSU72 n=1 Tax=Stichopus japonicus TaxID=307972 RepID=A0A2G8L6J8_STIJA|nr:putative RNA polymerase II subunit A C-terminal domain phosphatase SSU72 [Apostichopus japonicus]
MRQMCRLIESSCADGWITESFSVRHYAQPCRRLIVTVRYFSERKDSHCPPHPLSPTSPLYPNHHGVGDAFPYTTKTAMELKESHRWVSIPENKIVSTLLHTVCETRMIQVYTQNGILHMLDRNRRIKSKPERFQDNRDVFDVVVTVEERVFDQVVEDLQKRGQLSMKPVHVFNMEVKDNHDEATLGAFLICELCQMLHKPDDLENELDELILEFESKAARDVLHAVAFY